jgi:ataxia telangiectasia mutated family protein
MRRANVPAVCRAACHTAHTLLSISHSHTPTKSYAPSKRLLTSHRVLVEIETLAKDLDVQGPPFPYDSVCLFLAGCLRVASQDVRLYRMQLEEKVVGWLMDCWRIGEARSAEAPDRTRMPLYTIKDTLVLLQSICGFPRRCDLVCRVLLPECLIVEIMENEWKTKVIQDFLLSAKLPGFRRPSNHHGDTVSILRGPADAADVDLAQPRGRERRVSAFMLKSLDALIAEWESIKETKTHPSAEKARRSLDTAVIGLSFESFLVCNGIKATRRVVQCACKLVGLVTPLLMDSRWTAEEKALVLLGLEPLTRNGEAESNEDKWEAMVIPDEGTGIKKQTLKALLSDVASGTSVAQTLRREFQRIIWQNVDVSHPSAQWLRALISCFAGSGAIQYSDDHSQRCSLCDSW